MLGKNVREHRTQMGLTQEELAEKVGVWQSFIGQIERGEKQPSVGVLVKLADALGVTTEDLLRNGHIAEGATQ